MYSNMWTVFASDAFEKDEGEGEQKADGAKDVPSLASSKVMAKEEVVAGVGKVSDKNCRNAVCNLPRKKNDACVGVVEL